MLIPGSCFLLVFLSPSLSGQMPDTVTPAPGWCLPLVSLSPSLCGQMPVSRLSPCVSQVLCGQRPPGWCLRLCGQMPDAVTPACRLCPVSQSLIQRQNVVTLPLVSLCLPRSLRSDARCCDAGCGVVSPACLPVSPGLCGQMLDVVSPACLPVSSTVCGQMCLPLVSLSPSLSFNGQML